MSCTVCCCTHIDSCVLRKSTHIPNFDLWVTHILHLRNMFYKTRLDTFAFVTCPQRMLIKVFCIYVLFIFSRNCYVNSFSTVSHVPGTGPKSSSTLVPEPVPGGTRYNCMSGPQNEFYFRSNSVVQGSTHTAGMRVLILVPTQVFYFTCANSM